MSSAASERALRDILRLCHSGLDSESLRLQLLQKLQPVIPFDSITCGTLDPATLLLTSHVGTGIPEDARPAFLANELLEEDFNKIVDLAAGRYTASTLEAATKGRPAESQRYRNILCPLGFGNELRAVLRAGSSCWGVICLHRGGLGFSRAEESFLEQISPHLAEGLRMALLLRAENSAEHIGDDSPGLVVLSEDLNLIAVTPAAEAWLSELDHWPPAKELPHIVRAVALRLLALERTDNVWPKLMPRVRVRCRDRWVVLHASRLPNPGTPGASGHIAVILQLAHSAELAPMILQAYGLTRREAEVASLALRGLSTKQIAVVLVISPLTVQQHLKAVFEKTGVSSRRELVAHLFAEQYWPRMFKGAALAANGWFA